MKVILPFFKGVKGKNPERGFSSAEFGDASDKV
jgi:hypothetical protein